MVEWGEVAVIVSLVPRTDFAPVPRMEVALGEEAFSWDGGGSGDTGPDQFDGGNAGTTGTGFDAGSASTVSVELPAGTNRYTLWRRADGRRMKVRGAVGRTFSGSLGVQDMEAPFARPCEYELECFAGEASLGTVPIGQAVLPPLPGEKWRTLIQQPLTPRLWAIVEDVDTNANEITRRADGEMLLTERSELPSLIGHGPRRGIEGAELVLAADTREVARRVWATLGTKESPQLQVWLIRGNHPFLPGVFFCSVADLRERMFDIQSGGEKSRFYTQATEIAPPAPALVEAPLRYSDLKAVFPTYSALKAALPRYSQVNTAFEYAGAGG